MKRRALGPSALSALAWLAGCSALVSAPPPAPEAAPGPAPAAPPPDDAPPLPAPRREFRGAWVASVANIDWPSKPGLSAAALRAEALALLDRARALGLNAVVLQVRPGGDAIYPSALEPWSEWLSGTQGQPPWQAGEAAWDPLAFWVQEAHRRALELHAWFNPYRARPAAARSPLVAPHIGVKQPGVVRRYGDQLWMDPAEPAAMAQTLAVVADVLRRYDVDGIHIDDYFYPYPVSADGAELPFPDDEPWARYQLGGGALAREDWRRAQVDDMVRALQRTVREVKPWARFGVSPFGLGKPERRPPGVAGFSQYDKLYADAERWLEQGWLDYFAPQLYWPIAREGQPFPVLLDYWLSVNPQRRHLWPGLFTSQARAANPWPAREFVDQIDLVRQRPDAGGHIHFSLSSLLPEKDPQNLGALLQLKAYAEPALVPATPWLEAPAVGRPRLRREGAAVLIEPAAGEAPRQWALWQRRAGAWRFEVLPAQERRVSAASPLASAARAAPGGDLLAVAAVNRVGLLGESAIIRL